MIKLSALPYYISTITSLCIHTSWWKIPELIFRKPILYTVPLNLRFYISNLMDIWTLQEVIIDQHYERFAKIPLNGVVIDVGGSIGDFSIYSEKIRKARVIHSFEPNPERISLFQKNMQLHNSKHIVLHPEPASSLDEIFKNNNVSHCDFMKVDCEGGEYPIFKHASLSTLQKIHHIAFEFHLFTPEMKRQFPLLKKKLINAHFELIEQSNPVHDTIGFLYATNSQFLSPKSHGKK